MIDPDFQKVKSDYDKKEKELRGLISKYFSGNTIPTREDTHALFVLNFEVQALCEVLLEKKVLLDPQVANKVTMILRTARSNTYNC